RETKMPVTFAMLQSIAREISWQEQMATVAAENAKGANIHAQIALRGTGILMAWRGTVHPFILRPSWAEIAGKPWDQQLKTLRDPSFRARFLAEQPAPGGDLPELRMVISKGWFMQYEMGDAFNYEPKQNETIMALAAAKGVSGDEYAYDLLM